MNPITPIIPAMFAAIMLAPEATRPEPTRLEVTGTAYAYTTPDAEVVDGLPVMYSIGYAPEGTIAFSIDPTLAYTVHTFDQGGEQVDEDIISPIVRAHVIEHIIEQRIVWEREFNKLRDGTHPSVEGPIDYFEFAQAIARVHARMEDQP